jgi:hypothetical protein
MAEIEEEYGPDTTYCEWLAKTRWGAYIHGVEERAILIGHRARAKIGARDGDWRQGWTVVSDAGPLRLVSTAL